MTTLAVVNGGLREPSSTALLADRLTSATVRDLGEADVVRVNLRDYAHELTDALLTGFPGARLAEALSSVWHADGLIAVTPIFSGSYTGLFKTFFDVTEDGALAGMPTLLAATAGTPRHSLATEHALRPLFTYLRAAPVPTAVFAATDDFGAVTRKAHDGEAPLSVRADRAAGELAAAMRASSRTHADPMALTTSFEDLLRG